MWPLHLDYSKEECLGILRGLELKAYSSVIDALRAGGDFDDEKSSLLSLLRSSFKISVERHKTEVRRAINSEILNTISEKVTGPDNSDAWKKEGRRIIPLLPRAPPITGYTQVAEAAKKDLKSLNHELPPPWETKTQKPLPPLQRDVKTPPIETEFVKPEPVELNGSASSPEKVKVEVKEEAMDEEETGLVILPSGMAVRLREDKTAGSGGGKKGGKRKRSVSKSIEVFPKGVPVSTPIGGGNSGRRGSLSSPPRKVSSPLSPVHQAGHGYARPPPSTPTLPQSPTRSPKTAAASAVPSTTEGPLMFSPPKRGPGRPPGSSSPSVAGRGQASVRTRAPRAPRTRGTRGSRGRGGAILTTRGPVPLNNVPVVITQSPLVQGSNTGQPSIFTPVHPTSRSFRTSTPKLPGLSNRDMSAHLNNQLQGAGIQQPMVNAGQPVPSTGQLVGGDGQHHPQEPGTSLADGGSKQVSLQTITQALGYLNQHPNLSGANPVSSTASQGNINSHGLVQLTPQVPSHSVNPPAPQQVINPTPAQQPSHGLTQGIAKLSSQGLAQLAQGMAVMPAQKTVVARDQLTASVLPAAAAGTVYSAPSLQLASNASSVGTSTNSTIQFSNQSLPQYPSQGLKVISHNTKIVPKSAGTVYVMPGTNSQRMITPSPRVVTVSLASGSTPRNSTPAGVSSVIRTIRTSAFPGSNKSVIVVQKSGPAGVRAATRPNTVALYRPATVARGGVATAGIRGQTAGVMRIPPFQRPTLIRQQSANGNLYLVELGQEHQNPPVVGSNMAETQTLQRIISKPLVNNSTSKPMPIVISSSSQTLSKKIIVQAPNEKGDIWLQMKDSTTTAAVKPAIDPTKIRLQQPAQSPANDGDDAGLSNYSDIFSQALEQANIPVDTPLAAQDLEPALASKSLSAGRFVTLPPRGNAAIPPVTNQTSVSILDHGRDTGDPPPTPQPLLVKPLQNKDDNSSIQNMNSINPETS